VAYVPHTAARDVHGRLPADRWMRLPDGGLTGVQGRMRAILTYHSIDRSGSVISTDPRVFRRHAEWLAGSGVAVVGLADLVARPPAGPAVALTFDDAFANVATEAWPVLESLGLPATLFVPTAHVGGRNAWEEGSRLPVLPLLDWDELGRLAERGMILGAHSHTHVDLRAASDADLVAELEQPAVRIRAETGCEATTFAYPFGGVDDRVAAATGGRYGLAVTTEFAAIGSRIEHTRLPRLDAWYFRDPARLERYGTRSFEMSVGVRRGLRRVRSLLTRG
jgi:peptidoglycan/xylan/chitin deacetylase (PgdA/CDA1 family)